MISVPQTKLSFACSKVSTIIYWSQSHSPPLSTETAYWIVHQPQQQSTGRSQTVHYCQWRIFVLLILLALTTIYRAQSGRPPPPMENIRVAYFIEIENNLLIQTGSPPLSIENTCVAYFIDFDNNLLVTVSQSASVYRNRVSDSSSTSTTIY